MSTNGIVTLTRGGKTWIKAVAGCNGQQAPALARLLREYKTADAEDVIFHAGMVDFGCKDCFVVLRESHDPDGDLPALYHETFDQPRFNPRRTDGKAEYIEVIEADWIEGL